MLYYLEQVIRKFMKQYTKVGNNSSAIVKLKMLWPEMPFGEEKNVIVDKLLFQYSDCKNVLYRVNSCLSCVDLSKVSDKWAAGLWLKRRGGGGVYVFQIRRITDLSKLVCSQLLSPFCRLAVATKDFMDSVYCFVQTCVHLRKHVFWEEYMKNRHIKWLESGDMLLVCLYYWMHTSSTTE